MRVGCHSTWLHVHGTAEVEDVVRKMDQCTRVTSTKVTVGERIGLEHAARRQKRDMSEQAAAYIVEGLKRDGYGPDSSGRWMPDGGGWVQE